MQLTVLGATGRTGMAVVRQALERGHGVQVLVRDAGKASLLPADDRLSIISGDLLDEFAVAKAIDGADAVVNVAGPDKRSPKDLQQRAVAAILAGMRDEGVDRLVTLTGAGVRDPGDQPKVIDRVFRFALSRLQPALLADSEAAVAAVRASDLKWTVARAPRLTDEAPRGTYHVARYVGPETGTKLARGDLARFILDEVVNGDHVGTMPVVSG